MSNIKWSDIPGEWWCPQCRACGYSSAGDPEHVCDPYRAGKAWAARLKQRPAGTVDREQGMRVEVRG